MTLKYTSPAVVEAIPTLDLTGVPLRPEVVAGEMQGRLSELISAGYEVLCVTPVLGAILCVGVRGAPAGVRVTEYPRVPAFGCEDRGCVPGRHTPGCPQLALEGKSRT